MKQGSADDPFAEDTTAEPADDEQEADESNPDTVVSTEESQPLTASPTQRSQTQSHSLPYIHARDGVKDGRMQRPVFLRDPVEEGIDDLVDQMEDEFGETVYKTDVTEAAMVVAQQNPELLLEVLEEWGYGWS